MSILDDAIEYLKEAEEAIDTEAEIDPPKEVTLFEIRDRIRDCRGDLEEIVENLEGED